MVLQRRDQDDLHTVLCMHAEELQHRNCFFNVLVESFSHSVPELFHLIQLVLPHSVFVC